MEYFRRLPFVGGLFGSSAPAVQEAQVAAATVSTAAAQAAAAGAPNARQMNTAARAMHRAANQVAAAAAAGAPNARQMNAAAAAPAPANAQPLTMAQLRARFNQPRPAAAAAPIQPNANKVARIRAFTASTAGPAAAVAPTHEEMVQKSIKNMRAALNAKKNGGKRRTHRRRK